MWKYGRVSFKVCGVGALVEGGARGAARFVGPEVAVGTNGEGLPTVPQRQSRPEGVQCAFIGVEHSLHDLSHPTHPLHTSPPSARAHVQG